VLAKREEDVVPAALYVRYVPKQEEYRVHIFQGQVIDVQRKARKHDFPDPDWQIRNHANGFIYARNNLRYPECIEQVALEAYRHFNLDFGAVDIIWTESNGRALALEINTAPGLEGQTVDKYAEAITGAML